jgi:hypothetical protein
MQELANHSRVPAKASKVESVVLPAVREQMRLCRLASRRATQDGRGHTTYTL